MITTGFGFTLALILVINLPCFISSNNFKIVGGNETTIEKHPWMVSIQFLSVHFCGGSIIKEDTILTAAHCFDENASGLTIVAGSTDLREPQSSIRVTSILTHEGYDIETKNNDIAILKLSQPLIFSEKIQPILLPDENEEVPDGTLVVVSGWGVTSEYNTETSNILMEIQIPVIDWTVCSTLLSITDKMLCAGDLKGGRDSCYADSGGALELNTVLIGIVSWGQGCGEADYPGVYTHVGRFRSWIKQHTGV